MHRFFIGERDFIDEKGAIIHSSDLRHQWVHVLRFKEGERVVLFRGDGEEYEMEITKINEESIALKLYERRFPKVELPYRLLLAPSFLKHAEKFELMLQKGVELGVAEFTPLVVERTERRMKVRKERWEKIIKEAAEQSGRSVIPVLNSEMAVSDIFANDRLVLVPHVGSANSIPTALSAIGEIPKEIVVCIGPEGGFSKGDIDTMESKGAVLVGLGPRVLRAETAGIVAAAFVAQYLEVYESKI